MHKSVFTFHSCVCTTPRKKSCFDTEMYDVYDFIGNMNPSSHMSCKLRHRFGSWRHALGPMLISFIHSKCQNVTHGCVVLSHPVCPYMVSWPEHAFFWETAVYSLLSPHLHSDAEISMSACRHKLHWYRAELRQEPTEVNCTFPARFKKTMCSLTCETKEKCS